MNTIDILVLALILLGALQGYRKGIITGVAQFAGTIIGFFVASLEYNNMLKWLEQFFPLQSWLQPIIYKFVLTSFQTKAGSFTELSIDKFLQMLPPEMRNFLLGSNLLWGQPTATMTQGYIEQSAQSIASFLTDKVLALLAFILVFFIVLIIIQLIISFLLAPLGIFGGAVNRGGGLLFGGLCAFIILAVICGIFLPIFKINAQSSGLTLIERSFFLPYLLQTFQTLSQVFALEISKELQAIFNILK